MPSRLERHLGIRAKQATFIACVCVAFSPVLRSSVVVESVFCELFAAAAVFSLSKIKKKDAREIKREKHSHILLKQFTEYMPLLGRKKCPCVFFYFFLVLHPPLDTLVGAKVQDSVPSLVAGNV